MLEPPQRMVNEVSHFLCSSINSLLKRGAIMGNRNGLKAFKVGFYHAAQALITVLLFTILIAQVNINGRNTIADSDQNIFHDILDPFDHGLIAFNVVVSSN